VPSDDKELGAARELAGEAAGARGPALQGGALGGAGGGVEDEDFLALGMVVLGEAGARRVADQGGDLAGLGRAHAVEALAQDLAARAGLPRQVVEGDGLAPAGVAAQRGVGGLAARTLGLALGPGGPPSGCGLAGRPPGWAFGRGARGFDSVRAAASRGAPSAADTPPPPGGEPTVSWR